MATYEETLSYALMYWPTSFLTEWDVLGHLFYVQGNGYSWGRNGQMQLDQEAPTPKQNAQELEASAKRATDPDYKAELLREAKYYKANPYDPEPLRQIAVEYQLKLADFFRGPKKTQLYPLSQHSLLCCLPYNIQPDWLAAARAAVTMATSVYYSYTRSDEDWLWKATQRIKFLEGK